MIGGDSEKRYLLYDAGGFIVVSHRAIIMPRWRILSD